MSLPPGYCLRQGSSLERALLVKFMQRTYEEMKPGGNYAHLGHTVDQYLSKNTPLWWVDVASEAEVSGAFLLSSQVKSPIACLWLGNAIDQIQGDRHSHVFLLYVAPNHRRQGIGLALMHYAESWARERGDRQLGLQVFQNNIPALTLYRNLGFYSQSTWMVKPL